MNYRDRSVDGLHVGLLHQDFSRLCNNGNEFNRKKRESFNSLAHKTLTSGSDKNSQRISVSICLKYKSTIFNELRAKLGLRIKLGDLHCSSGSR